MDWKSLKILEVSFTTYCNANCPLCARTDKTTGVKKTSLPLLHYDIEKFKKMCDQIEHSEIKAIHLCGDYGDPFMHPHIEQAMDYAILGKNKLMSIDTNGGIRDIDFYEKIAKKYLGNLHINFSIDGFDQNTNQMYRVGVDFEKAKANCTAFAKHNQWPGNVNWQMLIFNFNYHQIDDVAEYCQQNSIMFDFKLNKRHWPKHTVKNPQIIQYVETKQQQYRHLRYDY